LRDALAAIRDARLYRDTHETFEGYLRDRWSLSRPSDYQLAPVRGAGYEVLAKVWDLAREEFGGDDVAAADIRLTVHKREHPPAPTSRPRMNPTRLADMDAATSLAHLRWLLTEAGGTIADVADQLGDRAIDFDDHARAVARRSARPG
jgi:hypothetical protein